MAEKQVVREDVISISFDVDDSGIAELKGMADEIKANVSQAVDDASGSIQEMAENASEVSESVEDMKKPLESVKESVEDLSAPTEDITEGFDESTDSVKEFSDKVKSISDKETDNLRETVEETTSAIGAATEATDGFVTKLRDIGKSGAAEELDKIKDSASETEDGFEDAGETGTSAIDMIADVLSAAGITLTLKGITDAAYEFADAFSEAESIVVQATGATGEALDGLMDSTMNIYSVSRYGTLDETAAAVGAINTRLGYTGEALENTTGLFVDFAAVTGSSASSAVKDVTQLMNQWEISETDMEKTLDKLTYAGQASGINVSTLSSELLNNKAILDELGFSMDEATAMFMKMELAGTNTSQVLMGFRTALSSGAISSLDDLKTVFGKLTDGTMSAEEAADMFGSRAGITIKNAAQMGVFSLDDLVAALGSADGTLAQTAENAQTMSQKWQQSTKGIQTAFTAVLTPAFEKITDVLTGLLSSFGGFLNEHPAVVKGITAVVTALAALASVKLASSVVSNIGGITSVFGKLGKASGGGTSGITGIFEGLAKIKTTVVLKGVANIAIIIAGVTALAAGVMLIAPYLAKLTDAQSLIKVLAVIAAVGLIGSGLAVLAGVVGNIPVATVALGLANIAIIFAGITALAAGLMLITPYLSQLTDADSILDLLKIITAVGLVGAALAVLAGLVGLIPIPVVVSGLAGIATAIGGFTAIVAAYAALASIPGFSEFMAKGGAALSQLAEILGNVIGSFVGGAFEGVASVLPSIGESLSGFAEAAAPFFEIAGSTSISGVGDFLKSFAEFVLMMTGNNILSFFTGGLDLSEVGAELASFAVSALPFFTTIAGIPQEAFDNAAALFECLGDIGNVPNSGGIAQWFSGTNDYAALAQGLADLGGAGVIDFFNTVAGIPQEAFDNAKLFFQSLSDIGNIPNSGGIAQWFSGTNDYEGLAEGLKTIAGGVSEFSAVLSGSVVETFTTVIAGLGDLGTAIDTLGGRASTLANANLPLLSSKFTSLSTTVMEVKSSVSKQMDAMSDAVKKQCSAIKTQLTDTASKIKSAFSGINLKRIGEDIMTGLLNGLKSKETELLNYVKSLAKSVPETMETSLDIGSPSRVMYEIGGFTAEGLINGISDSIPRAEDTSEQLSTAITYGDTENVYTGGNTTSETNNYNPTFNLTISGVTNEREMKRKVQQWIIEAMDKINASEMRKSPQYQIL